MVVSVPLGFILYKFFRQKERFQNKYTERLISIFLFVFVGLKGEFRWSICAPKFVCVQT